MKVQTLLNELRKLGVQLQLIDSQLKINAPAGVLTPAYIEQIKENRSAIVAYLKDLSKEIYRPIPRVGKQESYILSNSQKRLWVLSQLEGQSVAYNIPTLYRMRGALNITALAGAFRQLAERHESIRTVFIEKDGEPRQRILSIEGSGIGLVVRDFRTNPSEAQVYAQQVTQLPFDLERGPLLRAELLQVDEQEYLLVCSIHHIISDEWSMQVMVKEVNDIYNALSNGQSLDLPPLAIQYCDYAAWQQQELSGKQFSAHREYWLSKLEGDLPLLDLPADRSRPPVLQHHGSHVRYQFNNEQSTAFQQLLQEQQATLFMGVMALVNVLLFRYSGQSDLIVGTPVAGREHPDLEDQIGFYVNTLTFRNKISAQDGFVKVLEDIRHTTGEVFSHQAYPFDLLLEELGIRRDLSRSPLFDVMVVWHSGKEDNTSGLSLAGVQAERLRLEEIVSKFDLTFYFERNDSGLLLNIEYNTDLYDRERIEHMATHLRGLLDAVIKQPATAVASLNYLPATELELVLNTFNNTSVDWKLDELNLVSCFERQVALQPEQVALVSNDVCLSYKELNARANQVADWLRSVHGVNSNELIGISTARNEFLVIGILGILKAGAAYVPIDPGYPADRISYIIEDSKLRLVLTDQMVDGDMPDVKILCLNDQQLFDGYATHNTINVPQPSDIAYIIYTSGSTGNPKGVMIQHRSAVNVLASVSEKLAVTGNDRWVAITTYTFDMSVVELLLPLTSGCRLIIAGNDVSNMPDALAELLDRNDATVLQATPGMWNLLVESGWKGSKKLQVISGGEAMSDGLIKQLLNLTGRVWNMYGPTETTVFSTAIQITSPDQVHLIGKPVANTQTYILDEKLQPQPVGVPGELCIAGEGVASGYLNKETLTREKFVANPYGPGKLYRTGDIARWNGEGNIEFFGRKDNQVKIRGYRIELGEIEQCLLTSGLLNQAVVLAVSIDTEKSLVAYYTSDAQPATATLREYLQRKLPHYMVPAYFMELEALPLTSNGKVDRKALPVPHFQPRSYKPAVTETEQAIARIWEDVLGNKQVSMDDNFFDIGGHSLKAIQVISRIFKELSIKLELRDLFANPILSQLAEKVEVLQWINSPVTQDLASNTDEIII